MDLLEQLALTLKANERLILQLSMKEKNINVYKYFTFGCKKKEIKVDILLSQH